MNRSLLTPVALAVCVAPLSAQSFNIDFGQPTAGPPSGYAAAGLAGYWNAIQADTPVFYILKDLAGIPTNVQFKQVGAGGLIASNDPSVGGDDAALMNDGLITYNPNLDSCFYFYGLQPGTYELITYAWRPDDSTLMARSFVDNTPGMETSGGTWPGYHLHGVTYARHIVTVDSSGFMGPHSGLAPGANAAVGAVCNGMQLYRVDQYAAFCFGDGTQGVLCPCNNNGTVGHGCNNSDGTGGAILAASGMASLTSDTVQFTSSGEKAAALSIFLQGDASLASPAVFGQGLRCVGGALKRLYVKTASAGVAAAPVGADLPVHEQSAALADTIPAGGTRYYQTYYRDPVVLGTCPAASTFNVTQGVSVVWAP